jgi:plastocyanin
MSGMTRVWRGLLLAALLAGCGGSAGSGPQGPDGSGSGGDGGGGGGGGGQSPAATVTVGNNLFRSDHNGSVNPAVDTVAAGGTVRFTWVNTGQVPHSVESEGEPHFASSEVLTGNGKTYDATFTAPGTYEYDCAIHGAMMTGVIVVTP